MARLRTSASVSQTRPGSCSSPGGSSDSSSGVAPLTQPGVTKQDDRRIGRHGGGDRDADDLERPAVQGDRITDAHVERVGEGGLDHHAAVADPAALDQLGLVDRRGRGVAPHGLHV